MPRTKKGTPPAYRRHASGQAVVTVRLATSGRRDILLGPWDSQASHEEHARILGILAANGGRYPVATIAAPTGLSVNETILLWWRDAEVKRGPKDKELHQYKYACRPLKELYGTLPAAEFTPKKCRDVIQRMAELEWSRKLINRRLSRIKAVFSWAVAEELIPASVAHGLREVKGFQRGDQRVKESPDRLPAFLGDVQKVLPLLRGPVAAMLELQWLTGMRSGEVRIMRTLDIDQSSPQCWLYRPGSDAGPCGTHKNAWRGQLRIVPLGPRCIEIITPFLQPDRPLAYLFSPQQATAEANHLRRKNPGGERKTGRPKCKRKGAPGQCYTEGSYPQAVARACDKAGVKFNPYALRHGRKMDLERTVGSEAARCVLGQKSIEATQHYGQVDVARAAEVLTRLG
jgi:integrase